MIALVLLALPPIFTFTYTGVRQVDASVVDSARGMGMTDGQVLRRVQLPVALPLVLSGIRLASAAVIATATLAALVGGGGLGRYIIDGFGQQDYVKLVAGGILVALLALATEGLLSGLERLLVPRCIRLLSAPAAKRVVFKTA